MKTDPKKLARTKEMENLVTAVENLRNPIEVILINIALQISMNRIEKEKNVY